MMRRRVAWYVRRNTWRRVCATLSVLRNTWGLNELLFHVPDRAGRHGRGRGGFTA